MSNSPIIIKSPYIKGKGFTPANYAPIVTKGIPDYADSSRFPKVKGTAKWEQFWAEQLYYCTHGIDVGGWHLPGRYYYYLNFNNMETVRGIITPDMVDLHLELAYMIEFAFANGKDIICAKKRRAGISEFTQKAVTDYGWRFQNGAFKAGIAAGQDIYAQDFMNKWRASNALICPEFRINPLIDNEDEIIAGYTVKTPEGNVDKGTKNTFYVRTMKRDPALFKGLFLNVVVAEEAGEFEHLEKFLSHSRACLMDGSMKVGSFMVYGTGGNLNKGSKDFKKIWDEAKRGENEFIPFLIPAKRFHRPYYGGCKVNGELIEKTPHLLKEYKPFQLIGVEDTKAAEEAIMAERQALLKTKNQEKYQEFLKDYPLDEKDIFRKTVLNVFDTETMQDQADLISANPPKYFRCRLEWLKDKNGEIVYPHKVEVIIDDTLDEDNSILIHQEHIAPIKTHSNLYCAGLDSYDQDRAKTSKSKGAMCVLIRRNTVSQMQMAPVAVICARPRRKEMFYEMCLKLAIHFGLDEHSPHSLLIDHANKLIFKYIEERGYANILAYRPKKFEAPNSEQTHTHGLSINNHSKPLMVGLMQSAIFDYCKDTIWFPELINQLQNYDEVEIGSDNDLADAYGIALMQDVSNELAARDNKDFQDPEIFHLPEWTTDANGNKIMKVAQPYTPGQQKEINKQKEIDAKRFLSLD